jgi:lipid-A-disaccharide synthase
MAVIFPFETKFYEEVGLPVHFVGHPLMDREVKEQNTSKEIIAIKQSSGNPVIGLLPGSRKGEINTLLPIMLKAAVIIKKKLPSAQFIIPLAPGIERDFISSMLAQTKVKLRMTTDCFYETLEACDMAIVASGTATLETAVMLKPMIIIYKVSLLTYLIGKMLIRVPFIGLANLVAGKKIVPELIQNDATPEKIAAETTAILNDPHRLEEIKTDLAAVKKALGEEGASKEVASLAYEMIK